MKTIPTHPYIIRCKRCREVIFRGIEDEEFMDIYGDYESGAGECSECGKNLCEECGEFEDGICLDCREKQEKCMELTE